MLEPQMIVTLDSYCVYIPRKTASLLLKIDAWNFPLRGSANFSGGVISMCLQGCGMISKTKK